MTLDIAQVLLKALLFFLVYIIAVTISGAFKAWVAYMSGDDTAQEEGFITLNPLMHIDPVGLACFYFLHIGWGHRIPIDPRNILDRKKLVFTYLSDSFMNILMAIVSLVLLVVFFGPDVSQGSVSYDQLQQVYPHYASFAFMCMLVLRTLVHLCAWLAALNGISDTFKLVVLFFFPEKLNDPDAQYLINFGPILVMILVLAPLMGFLELVISKAGSFISTLLKLIS